MRDEGERAQDVERRAHQVEPEIAIVCACLERIRGRTRKTGHAAAAEKICTAKRRPSASGSYGRSRRRSLPVGVSWRSARVLNAGTQNRRRMLGVSGGDNTPGPRQTYHDEEAELSEHEHGELVGLQVLPSSGSIRTRLEETLERPEHRIGEACVLPSRRVVCTAERPS